MKSLITMNGIAKVRGSHLLDRFVYRIGVALLLSVVSVLGKAQEPNAITFYTEFAKFIPSTNADSVTLKVINCGCLGSKIIWTVKLKKVDKLISVAFYSPPPRNWGDTNIDNHLRLDTTFLVDRHILKQNLMEEFAPSKSKRFLMEGSFDISIVRRNVNKEFKNFKRGEGLYYILRFNKTYEDFFRRK